MSWEDAEMEAERRWAARGDMKEMRGPRDWDPGCSSPGGDRGRRPEKRGEAGAESRASGDTVPVSDTAQT